MIVFTGIGCVSLFIFETLFFWWKKSAKTKVKVRAKAKLPIHVALGVLAVLLALLHGLIAGHLLFENLLALLALLLLLLTAASGALARYLKSTKLRFLHIILCAITALLVAFHIPTSLLQLL